MSHAIHWSTTRFISSFPFWLIQTFISSKQTRKILSSSTLMHLFIMCGTSALARLCTRKQRCLYKGIDQWHREDKIYALLPHLFVCCHKVIIGYKKQQGNSTYRYELCAKYLTKDTQDHAFTKYFDYLSKVKLDI